MAKKHPIIKQKSILEEIWQDIELYIYLWKNSASTLHEIGEALGYKYPTIHRLVDVRVKQGIIEKTRVRPIVMGERKLTFSLAEITIAFLEKLRKEINIEGLKF
jgi:DNA-binding MarR family transcriptional regulator